MTKKKVGLLFQRDRQDSLPTYVRGLKGIMDLFGVSKGTASKYRKTFLSDACTMQGRIIMVDVDKARELFKNQ